MQLQAAAGPEKVQIPVIFHNLGGYDAHLLMQAMARVPGEIKCIPNNTEKYISSSFGNVKFIDSINFLRNSLDKLVKSIDRLPDNAKNIRGRRQAPADVKEGNLSIRVHGRV